MPSATLTSKGQLTLPKPIRDYLRVQPGDLVDFLVDEAGDVHVRAGSLDVMELQGLLRKPGRAAVSLGAMDKTIRHARGRQP
jgi:AbrB family looped-hinge helix DNA binding protein